MTKKTGTEGGPDNPESFRDREWRPNKLIYCCKKSHLKSSLNETFVGLEGGFHFNFNCCNIFQYR